MADIRPALTMLLALGFGLGVAWSIMVWAKIARDVWDLLARRRPDAAR